MTRFQRQATAISAVLCLLAAMPRAGFAQDSPADPENTAEEATPAAQPKVPLLAGDAAPFDGILFSEADAIASAELQIELGKCDGLLLAKTNALTEIEAKLALAKTERKPLVGNTFWWGFGMGLVASAVIAYGAIQAADAIK